MAFRCATEAASDNQEPSVDARAARTRTKFNCPIFPRPDRLRPPTLTQDVKLKPEILQEHGSVRGSVWHEDIRAAAELTINFVRT